MVEIWTVYPDDPWALPASFDTREAAQEWADELCCSYWIDDCEVCMM